VRFEDAAQAGTVLILGMHRSGTSCLAGALQEAGLHLGNVNEKAPHNAKGNRENKAIMDLHDKVLAASGGSWDAPPPSVTWSSEHAAARDALIAHYPVDRLWGFKDPRTLLSLEGWLEALPLTRCVGTFRHPLAVAQSLAQRNRFPPRKSLELWLTYNRRLLRYQSDLRFDVINFDWPADRYREKLRQIVARLGLVIPERGWSFFQPELRTHIAETGEPLPTPVAEVYSALQEIAN